MQSRLLPLRSSYSHQHPFSCDLRYKCSGVKDALAKCSGSRIERCKMLINVDHHGFASQIATRTYRCHIHWLRRAQARCIHVLSVCSFTSTLHLPEQRSTSNASASHDHRSIGWVAWRGFRNVVAPRTQKLWEVGSGQPTDLVKRNSHHWLLLIGI